MVDVAVHLAVQPLTELCTIPQGLSVPRANRQHTSTAADIIANTDKTNFTFKMSKS